jgi:hypothetical protein
MQLSSHWFDRGRSPPINPDEAIGVLSMRRAEGEILIVGVVP